MIGRHAHATWMSGRFEYKSSFKFAKQVRHQPWLFSTEMKCKGRNSISAHNARQTLALALCCANCMLWYESLPFVYYTRLLALVVRVNHIYRLRPESSPLSPPRSLLPT